MQSLEQLAPWPQNKKQKLLTEFDRIKNPITNSVVSMYVVVLRCVALPRPRCCAPGATTATVEVLHGQTKDFIGHSKMSVSSPLRPP